MWGPVNYITWVGIQKYASAAQISQYADRSVQLFMREWLRGRVLIRHPSSAACCPELEGNGGNPSMDPDYSSASRERSVAMFTTSSARSFSFGVSSTFGIFANRRSRMM